MKSSVYTNSIFPTAYITSLIYCFLLLIPITGFSQSFQRNFGAALDDSFSKVIKSGSDYYVLGQSVPSVGALPRATVTRLDAQGLHQWTTTLDISSIWNDAILITGGDLLMVGWSLPFDTSTKSLVGRINATGAFTWVRSYDEPGRDFFTSIVENPVPEDAAFPYYVLGSQNQSGGTPTTEDVVLLNLDAAGNLNWKKIYTSAEDDEFFRDLNVLSNGELLLTGNGASGLIFKSDNEGNLLNGVQIPQISFNDIGLESAGGIYASANNLTNSDAHILKFDQNLILQWDVIIPQLNTVKQVWEGNSGEIYVTGSGTFGSQPRDVIVKLFDSGPSIVWVKYLNAGNGFVGGSSWLMPGSEIAFTDARVIPGGFGGNCAFISVSDLDFLTACLVSDDMATLIFADPIPDGPVLPLINIWDVPMGTDLSSSALDWLEDEVCTNDPCGVSIDVTFVDNCGHVQVTSTATGPQPYSYQWCYGENTPNLDVLLPCGPHTFCVTVTCGDGSTSTASQLINIVDNTPPTAICIPPFGVDLDANCMFNVTVPMIDGGSFDDCQIQSMSVSPSVLNGCGVFPITLTVEDWCGNVSTCMTEIQTIEVVPPLMTCPVNLTLACDDDLDPSNTGFPTVIDNCDPNPVVNYSDVISGQMPCDGQVTRTWTATDSCGNVSTCVQTITVFDNVPPNAVCIPSFGVDLDANCMFNVTPGMIDGGSTDNCQIQSMSVNPSVLSGCGVFEITLTVVDLCGNTSTCTTEIQTIEVVPPIITCPPNLTLACDDDLDPNNTGIATATDNCDPNPTITYSDVISGQMPCDGLVTRTWTATDNCGNVSTCLQTITVFDNVPPNAVCIPSFGVDLDANCMFNVTPGMIDGGSTDNCQIQSMSVNPSVLTGCGVFEITLTVVDLCGNTSTCTTEIQTIEVVPPIITCPPNLTLACDDDLDPSNTGFATATDNCDTNTTITYSDVISGQMPCDGLVTRTWTATDNCGNVSTCLQTITVFDNVPPVIICPQNVIVSSSSPAPCEMVVNGIQWLSATDNCGIPSVSYNITGATTLSGNGDASGQVFNQGVSIVMYTATDGCGNTASCSFMVTVECTGMEPMFKCGMAVVTCFSGFISGAGATVDPNGPVLALVDLRNHATAPLGVNWAAVSSTGIVHDPDWDAQHMGQVFGVTIDNNYNVYTSSTTIYGKYLPVNSPTGGFGNVYKINALTGVVTTFATLPQDANDAAGLGDVWYDKLHNQIFVSNFYDGLIYRYDMSGTLLSTYDFPGTSQGNSSPGFIPRGERVWAVATQAGTLYFSVWNEDRSNIVANVQNQIWSVQLNASGTPTGNAVLEKDMPSLLTYSYSSPVSDISFSETGNMLVAERSMNNDFGDAFVSAGSQAHASRIIELSGATWGIEKQFYVGNLFSDHINSSGGIDYGYDSFDPMISPTPLLCDSMVWGTGDALRFPGYNNIVDPSNLPGGGSTSDYVYGLAGIAQSGNSNLPTANNYVKNSSIYIDVDNNLSYGEKLQIGDIDVFKNCIDCPEVQQVPCDSLMVTINEDPPGNQCCFSVDIKNNFGPSISKLQIDVCTPGIYINTQHIAPGFQFTPTNSNQSICVTHISGSIPSGMSNDIISFCYSGNSGPGTFPQTLKFTWYQNVGGSDVPTECSDTTHTDCIITDPPNEDPCIAVTPLEVDCDPTNPYEYILTFKVTNLSSIPSFNAYTVNLYGLPPGFSFSPCVGPTASLGNISIPIPGAPLPPTGMSGNMCVKIISSTPILSPQTICANAKLIGIEDCCTVDDQFCFTLVPCCDPCESIAVTVAEMQVDTAECCYALGVVNNCPYPYFTKIEVEPLGGVTFGYYALNSSLIGSWSLSGSTNTKLCIRPNGGTIPGGTITDLVGFCLDNINNPSQIPQTVVIRWMTPDINGVDSVACDTTLTFECEVGDYDCLIIDSLDITCIPDSSKYQLNFTVTNISSVGFCATSMDFIQLAPADLIFSPSTSYTFPTPLCPNQSQTVSICLFDINGLPGGGNLVFIPKLSFMDQDTCCYEGEPVEIPLPPCDTCVCSISTMNLSTTSGSNFTVTCNQSDPALYPNLSCQSGDVTIAGNIGCTPMNGATSCPPEINWWLSNQNGPITNGSSTSGNFTITFPESLVSAPGTYTFVSTTLCPGALEACPCYVHWVQEACDPCCTDSTAFFNAAEAVQLNEEPGNCMVHYNATGLDSCMQISYLWGENPPVLDGPYTNNTEVWHTYAASGTYNVCYYIDEVNANDSICWTYEHCEEIQVVCDTCACGTYSEMSYRPVPGAPNIPVECNDTLTAQCNGLSPWNLSGIFLCDGNSCPDSTQMFWMLMKPNSTTSTGSMYADPGFGISIPPTEFDTTGTYDLILKAICGQDTCYCDFTILVECDTCCSDYDAFLATATSVQTNGGLGDCMIHFNATGLDSCMQISYVWGDNPPIVEGPYTNNTEVWHTYPSEDTYNVCYIIEEVNTNDSICWTYEHCEDILVLCEDCECEGFWDTEFIGDWGPVSVDCDNDIPVQLGCPDEFSWFHGNTACTDTCLMENVNWTLQLNGTTISNGTVPIYFLQGGNVGHFDIPFDDSYFTQSGTYTLTVVSHCDGNECPCVVTFSVPPCDNNCSCDDPIFPVSPTIVKSIFTLVNSGGCSKILYPAFNLTPCDTIFWSYQTNTGSVTMGTSYGNGPLLFTFPSAGTYFVCMSILRTEPDGTKCEEERCQKVIINCGIPPIECADPKVFNPGFFEGVIAGDLNGSGQSEGWTAAFGNPEVFAEQGCGDDAFVRLEGNLSSSDGLSTTTIVLEPDVQYSMSFCYRKKKWSCEKKGDLKVRLSDGSQDGIDCTGNCILIGEYPLEGEDETWYEFTGFFTVEEAYNTLTLHVGNASAIATNLSAFDIDNICIQPFDFLIANREITSNTIKVFPNPTNGTLNVQVEENREKASTLQILDLTGRTLQTVLLPSGQQQHSLSIANLPAGIYFIKITENGMPIWIEKIIKQ